MPLCSKPAFFSLISLPDITSFAVVSRLRRILGMKKVGHAGTLDPFATGLLIVCAGRQATRIITRFMEGEKEYLATLQLGVETATHDTEGQVTGPNFRCGALDTRTGRVSRPFSRQATAGASRLFGAEAQRQTPLLLCPQRHRDREGGPAGGDQRACPDGRRSSASGRGSQLDIRVVCSKGTYIRTLAADIGRDLGCGAHLTQLRRIRSGCFSVDRKSQLGQTG